MAHNIQSDDDEFGDQLCSICQHFDLTPERLKDNQRFILGQFDKVKARNSCPLCRLVVSALFDVPRTFSDFEVNDMTEISITWREARKGFEPKPRPNFGNRICFVHDGKPGGRDGSSKRLARLVKRKQIDPELVKRWLASCESLHADACTTTHTQEGPAANVMPSPERFRVIDVRDQCIVNATSPCRYLTLSYVWGLVPTFRLLQENAIQMMTTGALISIRERLPQTIRDAIALVAMIGERYLWVDMLCIIQDDTDDVRECIQVMDLVYERSILTIIGAAGTDANAGLPGVRVSSRYPKQLMEEVEPGLTLVVLNELDDHLKVSHYNSRAWTFQEEYLSARSLVFVNNQAYFRCRKCIWREESSEDDTPSQNYDTGRGSLLSMTYDLDFPPLLSYDTLILYYAGRNLTKQSDALNALAGILRRLSVQMKCRLFEGLPTAAMDVYLLFKGQLDRNHSMKLRRRYEFPSYSWTGWIGVVTWELIHEYDSLNEWLAAKTWIIWYKRSPSGILNAVWDPAANEAFLQATDEDIGYRQRRQFKPPQDIHMNTTRTLPTEDLSFMNSQPSYSLLQFWTVSAEFLIAKISNEDPRPTITTIARVLDKSFRRCGWIRIDDPDSTAHIQESLFLAELIVFSECQRLVMDVGIPTEYDQEYYSADEPKDPAEWDFYWVMLIQWEGGTAERRGLGQIYRTSISQSAEPGPVWKEIILG